MTSPGSIDEVLRYHEQTKHYPGRFARSLGYLDWENQPDPFRRYEGAPLIRLDEIAPGEEPSFDQLYRPDATPARARDRAAISQLFYDSLALSAWKAIGPDRWSLRCNPSSGNLHPTEAYLLTGPVPGLCETAGMFHYHAFEHGLEQRAELPATSWTALLGDLPPEGVLIGLTSIHWREAWKYGERAYRYCQHDVGHAVAAVGMAAAGLGWRTVLLDGVADRALAVLLGVSEQRGAEAEHPDALLLVTPHHGSSDSSDGELYARVRRWRPADAALETMARPPLVGTPNRLSREHQPWPVIDEVAAAAESPGGSDLSPQGTVRSTRPSREPPGASSDPPSPRVNGSGRRLLRRRRSAVAMDGATSIDANAFYRMLQRVLPGGGAPALAALPWSPAVHLVLFVHRVDGLTPGLYLLVRDPAHAEPLRAAFDEEFEWAAVAGCPEAVPLYLLAPGDCRLAARRLSCDQAIASDGAFAVAMVAEFEDRLRRSGPWVYRHLFWETGAIGQLLYLEAEAAGVRGTGIGCFFDEPVHRVLGLQDRSYQSLYHFTVGGPVADPRLRTLPAYGHLVDASDV